MKVLLINGSLSERGALSALLEEAAEELKKAGLETELFWPIKTKSLMCSGCGACKGAGMCVADPRGREFVAAAAGCDGFLFAAPSGLLGIDVDMKNFLERIVSLTQRLETHALKGKSAAALVLCRAGGKKAAAQTDELLRRIGLRLPEGTETPVLRPKDPQREESLHRICAALAASLRTETAE